MTEREAIANIECARKWLGRESDFSDEALDLAISALEFKERYAQFWEEVKSAGKAGKETEIHHGGRVFRIREVAQ
jgi:hypothetical protein